jgi:glycerol uptake facilitator-like aquaporin
MGEKILKIAYAAFVALLTIGLVVFMIIHISKGLAGGNAKLILGAYILMIVWALMKLTGAIKNLK